MNRCRDFAFFFAVQFVSYFLIVANTRAYTHSYYLWNALTDAMFAAQNFFMVKKIANHEKSGYWAWAGYTLGGTAGSTLSIWVTKHLGF